VLADAKYLGVTFEIVVDCTGFTPTSELPLQWLRFCAEIVPRNIRERFMIAHFLNPNSLTQKYLRRLYNFMAGNDFLFITESFVDFVERDAVLFITEDICICC
jgi:neurofibromin 1